MICKNKYSTRRSARPKTKCEQQNSAFTLPSNKTHAAVSNLLHDIFKVHLHVPSPVLRQNFTLTDRMDSEPNLPVCQNITTGAMIKFNDDEDVRVKRTHK